MRRVHGLDRWQPAPFLRDARRHGGDEKDHNNRGPGSERALESSSGSIPGGRRDAVWVLHFGDDCHRDCAPESESSSDSAAGWGVYGGKHLPLRNLSANRRRCPTRSGRAGRSCNGRAGDKRARGGQPMSEKSFVRIAPRVVEPERYELEAPSPYHFELRRRDFFKTLGAGLLVVCVMKDSLAFQESGVARRPMSEDLPREISAWLHIGEDGKVTVYTGKVEVGQNIRTSLSQAVAEELHVPLEQIELVMGDTQLTPFDMGTFGSRTTPTMNLQLRKVASAARDTLVGLAAAQWKVDAQRLVATDGKITDPRGNRSVEYAALTKGQQLTQTLPAEDPLIPAADWKVAGQSVAKVDGRDFVTGRHRYPSDQKIPDMLYGKVLRPAAFGATLVSLETQKAEQLGATVVHDGDFVGVAAPSSKLAESALEGLRADWKAEPQPSYKELFDYLRKNTTEGQDVTGDGDTYNVGSVDQALNSADHKVTSTYTVAYIAHVPLEPRAALARWDGDQLTVWTGTQRPFGVRGQLAEAFHIPEDQ